MNETEKQAIPSAQISGKDLQIKSLKFVHQKNGNFQIFHADGGWGLVTRDGSIQIEFYTEHQPMPPAVVHTFEPDGNLSPAFTIEGVRDHAHPDQAIMVRDFQCAIVVHLPAAVQLHTMLGNFIGQLMQQTNPQEIAIPQQGEKK
jgi:hypothetical protein